MKLADLDFSYPQDLVATRPERPSRVACFSPTQPPAELSISQLLKRFQPGDILVVNDTRVTPSRVFTADGLEILFLKEVSEGEWDVLFPARSLKVGAQIDLPDGLQAELMAKGLPQRLKLSQSITADYFDRHGELALPPYIQEARGVRHNYPEDRAWYQTAWAATSGSVAAPTASLHFQASDLDQLRESGVNVGQLTLHVGAGTFLPVKTENLNDHKMHSEQVVIPLQLKEQIDAVKASGGRVWALGTTVTRALESLALNRLDKTTQGYVGATDLFIKPPFDYQIVDVLMTNFHQPKSTLLALVAAFSSLDHVKQSYQWAIDQRFRLFSYGDLSVWTKP